MTNATPRRLLARTMSGILTAIMTLKNVFVASFARTKRSGHTGWDLKVTTNIESKKLSPITHELRERDTGYPLAIFKQTSGSTSITSTIIRPPPSLIMTVSLTLTTLVLVTTGQLFLVYITLIPSSNSVTIALLVVTVINAVFTLRILHTLYRLWVWSLGASKGPKSRGQGKPTMTGGKGW